MFLTRHNPSVFELNSTCGKRIAIAVNRLTFSGHYSGTWRRDTHLLYSNLTLLRYSTCKLLQFGGERKATTHLISLAISLLEAVLMQGSRINCILHSGVKKYKVSQAVLNITTLYSLVIKNKF
ncbi:UNVERIFIED_CONTAM: hypothetical protein K2H54_043081 [Gekko kuhli]